MSDHVRGRGNLLVTRRMTWTAITLSFFWPYRFQDLVLFTNAAFRLARLRVSSLGSKAVIKLFQFALPVSVRSRLGES
jgi:hypothetical protein